MSSTELKITCVKCGFRQLYTPRNGSYDPASDAPGWMDLQDAWCAVDRRIVTAERLPQVSDLRAEIAELERTGIDDIDLVTGLPNPVSVRIGRLVRIIGWRERRQSPERCLVCGTIEITPLVLFDSRVEIPVHPGCGGTFEVLWTGLCSLLAPGPIYDAEGVRMGEPTPT